MEDKDKQEKYKEDEKEPKKNSDELPEFDENNLDDNNNQEPKGKYSFKTVIFLLFIVSLIIGSSYLFNDNKAKKEVELKYSELKALVYSGKITQLEEKGGILYGVGADKNVVFKAKSLPLNILEDAEFMKKIDESKVAIRSIEPERMPLLFQILISWFPMLLLIGIWLYMLRQMNKGSGGGPTQIFNMGKSKAKDGENRPKIKFDDVAGVVEAKTELKEVVDFLKEPDKFTKIGAKIPKGVLLLGEPGTGKTLLAKAVAGEAGVPFFSISGSEFVEMFVGVGASRVRDLFNKARKSSPCIVFIDEIDAVGRKRGSGHGGGNDEREQTLNQLLVEMDGFSTDEIIIVIAATNRPDVLDKALLRPGRFDRQVVVDAPDIKGREAILAVHARGKKFADDVDFMIIAKKTPGFVGANLANMLNEAAILAARNNREVINMSDLEEAVEKVMMGPERKSRVMSEKERINTAYHEVGHALIAYLLPDTDPVHKITIIPRGMSLGSTWQLPDEDKFTNTKKELMSEIKILLGGRAAEEIVFNDITNGASSDIDRASKLAYNMIAKWGMSDKLGPLAVIHFNSEFASQKAFSEETSQMIDDEIHSFINESYKEVKELLISHRAEVEAITKVLLEKETISGEEMENIIKGLGEQAEV